MRLSYFIALFSAPLLAFAEDATSSAPQQVAGGAATAAPQGAPQWTSFLFIGGIILFMWLFVFRPQSKRAKEQRDFLAALKPDMEVYTTGGVIGTITEVKDNIVVLNVGTSTVKVLKSSVAGKLEVKA